MTGSDDGTSDAFDERLTWLADFLRYAEKERMLSANTVAGYRRDLLQFHRFLSGYLGIADWRWDGVDRLAIRSFLGELDARGLRRSTVLRKLSAIRSFFSFLHRTDRVTESPARSVRAPKRQRDLPGYLTEERAEDLFELLASRARSEGSFQAFRDRALIELIYSSGLRLAEARGLDLPDLDLRSRQLRVLGKGDKERIVPIGDEAASALREYLGRRAGRTAPSETASPVFLSARGRRLSRRQMQRSVSAMLDRVAEGEKLSTHALRHSFATHMLDHGADLIAVKELLGHASLSTTRVYTHTSVERLQRVHAQAHPRASIAGEDDGPLPED